MLQPNLSQSAIPKVLVKRVLPLRINTIIKSSSGALIDKPENTKGWPATRVRMLKTTKSLKSTKVELAPFGVGLISEISTKQRATNPRITRSFSLFGFPKNGPVLRAPTIKSVILPKSLASPSLSQQQKFKMFKSSS
jgi:hypothetical protein